MTHTYRQHTTVCRSGTTVHHSEGEANDESNVNYWEWGRGGQRRAGPDLKIVLPILHELSAVIALHK